jgi:hypothetical protein
MEELLIGHANKQANSFCASHANKQANSFCTRWQARAATQDNNKIKRPGLQKIGA